MRIGSATSERQRGMALVSAIFLLVVLAGLGVFAVRINVLQQQTVTSGLRAAQAFHAAKSGIAWAAHRAIYDDWCGDDTLSLTEAGTTGFAVDVQCARSTHTEGSSSIDVFIIDVLAESGVYGGPDYVSRRLQVKITDPV
jgi:MSHA biogenesis protein MshP